MGRPKSIDRDAVLDVAEAIVRTQGAAALTLDAVAQAAGISKGGVQSCFGTKAALVDALFERFGQAYERRYREVADTDPSPVGRVRAHVAATFGSDEVSSAKAAGLLAALLQSPQELESTRQWYRERLQGLCMDTPEHRSAWLAFLAAEGAFMLRYFGLVEMNERLWRAIEAELQHTLAPSGPDPSADPRRRPPRRRRS
ncbi:MAG: TetR/AcrR family transcriptional regulator [Pseudomonadota bacterium]